MAELLVELFSEEIPANIQKSSIKNFESMILNNFIDVGLNYTTSEVFWSPMRLTLCIEGLDLKSEDLEINVWNSLKNNPRAPFLNRSMSGIYPPGSTIKMAVALAALENGIIDYNTKFYCNGLKELGSSLFHCWAKDGHGKLNLMEAIEQSCDVYFYELGLKIGIDKIALMMKKLGLGQYYDVEIND